MLNEVLITFDIDWSPDWMIDEVSELLATSGVKSTWFVTHASPGIERIRQCTDFFELGIHPNCLPGTQHGSGDREVLKHVKEIVPEAVSMRSHGLYQTSAFLLAAARDFGIRVESNCLFPGASGLAVTDLRVDDVVIRRVPFYWADDLAMRDPNTVWGNPACDGPGLKVLAFHPFHVVMNARDYRIYEMLKRERPLSQWTPDFVAPYRSSGAGVGTFFESQVAALAGKPTLFIKDLLGPAWNK